MILIAGGAGYIGSHANKILNKRGFKTVVYDNLSRDHRGFAKWGHLVLFLPVNGIFTDCKLSLDKQKQSPYSSIT